MVRNFFPWLGRTWRSLSIAGRVGFGIALAWLLIALFGPWLAPHGAGAFVAEEVFAPMSREFPFGSDYLGRDVLTRVLYGARYTVGVALGAAVLASSLGCALALTAVVCGGWIDEVVSRFMDTLISIPSKIFALVMVAAFGSSVALLLLIAGLSYLPGAFRISRAVATNLNAMDYVQVARARGEGRAYIAAAELLPNMVNPVLADFGLRFGFIVLLLSGMSFLGLGVQPPAADLGSLVRENLSGIGEGAPAVILPALAIATLTIGVNLLIDSLPGRVKSRSLK